MQFFIKKIFLHTLDASDEHTKYVCIYREAIFNLEINVLTRVLELIIKIHFDPSYTKTTLRTKKGR